MAPENITNELASRLRNNCVLNPITALAIHHVEPDRALVLAGEDTFLRVYDVATSRQLAQLRIFHSQPIHGIHISTSEGPSQGDETRLLIWGAQSVTVLPHASLQILIQGGVPPQPKEFKAADWIYDGILFPSNTNDGVLVTAHNEIVPISSSSDGQSLTFGPLTSPSRPILYSANLCWLSSEAVLVAGGTVFGEIIVWKYYLDPKRPSQWELLYVFTGHEGSIFGVSISPEIQFTPGSRVRLLASCSDDRTIRIWNISDPLFAAIRTNGEVSEDLNTLGDARETGFGGNSEVTEEHKNDSSRCLAVALGHVSRIWHVKFTGATNYHDPQMRPIEVWSFGEDCTRQKWELTIDRLRWQSAQNGNAVTDQTIGTLRHCSTSPCHIGKNIWSAAVSIGQYDQPLVVSGGADGKISISGDQQPAKTADSSTKQESMNNGSDYCDIDLTLSVSHVLQTLEGSELGHVTGNTDKQVKKGAVEGFQRYAFLSEQSFLATTTSGRLLLGTTSSGITWENINLSEPTMADLKIYNIIKSPARGLAVLGSASGKIYVFQQNSPHIFQELTRLPGKVSDIICLEDIEEKPNTWTIICTVLGLDHAIMLTFGSPSGAETMITSTKRIDLTPNFVITAAVFCNNTLVLGSRIGVLAVQKRNGEGFESAQSRKDCKTKDAVTCIVPLPGSSTSFLSGCRDGRYRIYTLTTTEFDETPVLHLQHEISPPLGMIEGAWFTKPTNANTTTIELVLYGFRGNNFVVWSETSRQELASVECGGAHRPFDYISPPSDSGQMKLVFTKASQMHFYSQRRPLLHALKEGGHGRELRAVASSSSHRYFATAAEDTTIRIWQYKDPQDTNSSSNAFKCLAIIEKHSAGIQCLKWHGDSYLLSSAGNEEFFIWRVTRLESDYESLAVVCEAVYTDRSADGDLRIMDFDVQSLDNDNDMFISLALSNSTIKSYLYSKEKGFRLLATGRYTGACLTQIRHLRVPVSGEIQLLTGSTDGYMAIWSTTTEVENKTEYALSSVVKLHQSTVKSLDITPIHQQGGKTTDGWLVATGGDDNSLGFMTLVWSASASSSEPIGKINVVNRSRVQGAHAAAITGLSFIKAEEEADSQLDSDSVVLATASNDQRVKLWRAGLEEGRTRVQVSLLDNQYSSVADPGDVEVIAEGRLMVGGVGMEVWDLL